MLSWMIVWALIWKNLKLNTGQPILRYAIFSLFDFNIEVSQLTISRSLLRSNEWTPQDLLFGLSIELYQ